jgi:8-oxo-dGTP pyrophosphatase MutT (NUDIX family)
MHKFTFPSKYISVSSSVILVRKHAQPQVNSQDYQILLLKRNPNISFGGLYAFPGGMVEK